MARVEANREPTGGFPAVAAARDVRTTKVCYHAARDEFSALVDWVVIVLSSMKKAS